jgi:hypothetical protein
MASRNAEAEAVRTFKKSAAQVLIKPYGFCKRLVVTMNENRNVTLFLVLCLVKSRKFVGSSDEKLLEIGASNLTPFIDVSQWLSIAHPVRKAIGANIGPDATLAAIINHPILWHLVKRASGLMHHANRPKLV